MHKADKCHCWVPSLPALLFSVLISASQERMIIRMKELRIKELVALLSYGTNILKR